jgi:hypothetical protein
MPSSTPNVFIRVIGSFRIRAAKIMTKMGTAVAMMEASTGDVVFNPQINSPWFKPTPQRAQRHRSPKSFNGTFS